jgi:hypothetical protein
MLGYVLLFKRDIIIGGLPTKMVGPFETLEEARAWANKHAADRADVLLSTIYTPANAGDVEPDYKPNHEPEAYAEG